MEDPPACSGITSSSHSMTATARNSKPLAKCIVYNTERHLLYVACTRARDHQLVTGVDPA